MLAKLIFAVETFAELAALLVFCGMTLVVSGLLRGVI